MPAVKDFGLARLTRLVIPGMRERRSGTIINLSSVFGRFAVPGNAYYAASKHAVTAFTGALRLELGRFGIRAVLIEPTAARTSLNTNTTWAASQDGSPYAGFLEDLEDWHARTYAGPPRNIAGRLAVSPGPGRGRHHPRRHRPPAPCPLPVGTLAYGLFPPALAAIASLRRLPPHPIPIPRQPKPRNRDLARQGTVRQA